MRLLQKAISRTSLALLACVILAACAQEAPPTGVDRIIQYHRSVQEMDQATKGGGSDILLLVILAVIALFVGMVLWTKLSREMRLWNRRRR